jgi:glycosyltransferase involved in cell wall biosynthesis
MNPSPSPIRLAVVCDYPEEFWPSMDLTGEMVLTHLRSGHAGVVEAERVCPLFRHRLGRLPVVGSTGGGAARNADRLLNRLRDYPRALREVARSGRFDVYHLVDHSYSQLLHVLPKGRAVVTCHDLDTFRCVLEPGKEPRPRWFRAMAGHILAGLKTAAAVACNSATTRDALLAHAVVPADRAHVVPMGTHPACSPDPDPAADAEAARLLGPPGVRASLDLLHVGSNIPRKRIDVLLKTFAQVKKAEPSARLLKVGGALPPDMAELARELGVAGAVLPLPFLDRATLAAVYRRAALVLLPSEAEGFGLPAVEALACGTPLLACDIPAVREVAGDAAEYRPVGDVAAWTDAALSLLHASPDARQARRASGIARARHFSWPAHADRLVDIYHEVLARLDHAPVSTSSR